MLLAAASAAATALVFAAVPSDDLIFRASMATAYVAMVLLGVTLAFGPVAALRGRRYPVSTDIRRDYGIWAGGIALLHVVIGLQVHLRGRMAEYFVKPLAGLWLPRADAFGFANFAGAAAALIYAALVATSNDRSLRGLGTDRWRRLHAATAWAAGLTVAHGVAYQLIEKRAMGFVIAFATLTVVAALPRLVRAWRRRVAGLRDRAVDGK